MLAAGKHTGQSGIELNNPASAVGVEKKGFTRKRH